MKCRLVVIEGEARFLELIGLVGYILKLNIFAHKNACTITHVN